MPTNENTGYLVQLQSPEGDKVYPIISAEMIKDSDGSTYDLSSLKDAVDGMGTTYATKTELEAVSADVEECFQSVSDGKALVASAITDKGVTTAADATFQQIASNINIIFQLDTSDATATAAQILSGYTAYAKGSKITGTMIQGVDLSGLTGKFVTMEFDSRGGVQVAHSTNGNPVYMVVINGGIYIRDIGTLVGADFPITVTFGPTNATITNNATWNVRTYVSYFMR